MPNWLSIHDLSHLLLNWSWKLSFSVTDRSAISLCWTKELVQSKHVKHTPTHMYTILQYSNHHSDCSKPPSSQLQHLCQSAHSSESHPLRSTHSGSTASTSQRSKSNLNFSVLGEKSTRTTIWNFHMDRESWNRRQPYLNWCWWRCWCWDTCGAGGGRAAQPRKSRRDGRRLINILDIIPPPV